MGAPKALQGTNMTIKKPYKLIDSLLGCDLKKKPTRRSLYGVFCDWVSAVKRYFGF